MRARYLGETAMPARYLCETPLFINSMSWDGNNDKRLTIFLNSANFAPNALLTLVPPSGYDLNLKAFIKVSKVS